MRHRDTDPVSVRISSSDGEEVNHEDPVSFLQSTSGKLVAHIWEIKTKNIKGEGEGKRQHITSQETQATLQKLLRTLKTLFLSPTYKMSSSSKQYPY